MFNSTKLIKCSYLPQIMNNWVEKKLVNREISIYFSLLLHIGNEMAKGELFVCWF